MGGELLSRHFGECGGASFASASASASGAVRNFRSGESQSITVHSSTGAMHAAVPRAARAPDLELDPALESVPLALPGLISSLRPIRRNAAQLADEAALLRRFMYKHKNQHKGQRWWKRIVEVDRCASRALEELSRWLAGFGMRCVLRSLCGRSPSVS